MPPFLRICRDPKTPGSAEIKTPASAEIKTPASAEIKTPGSAELATEHGDLPGLGLVRKAVMSALPRDVVLDGREVAHRLREVAGLPFEPRWQPERQQAARRTLGPRPYGAGAGRARGRGMPPARGTGLSWPDHVHDEPRHRVSQPKGRQVAHVLPSSRRLPRLPSFAESCRPLSGPP